MTDIRCPNCDHAFFAHVESRPQYDSDRSYDEYWCRGCQSTIAIPRTSGLSTGNIMTVTCLHCESDYLQYIWRGESMDGDDEVAYECPGCEDMVYSIRTCTAETATSPEYHNPNPFAQSAESESDSTEDAFGEQRQLDDSFQ